MHREATIAAWEHIAAGTTIGDANVEWIGVRHQMRCLTCAAEFPGEHADPSPRCSNVGLVVESAPQIAVEDWVLEEPT
ncbi:MAG: hydrogenase maturation nickel metallochaperone HypA [bacterium]|nr:hydrogenase maturation nickel metallochaperone HypA [bacterium]